MFPAIVSLAVRDIVNVLVLLLCVTSFVLSLYMFSAIVSPAVRDTVAMLVCHWLCATSFVLSLYMFPAIFTALHVVLDGRGARGGPGIGDTVCAEPHSEL